MKKLLALFGLILCLGATPLPQKTLILWWDYGTNEVSSDLVFKIYHTTDISMPWLLLTNVPGNITNVYITVDQAKSYFTITASNFWGEVPPSLTNGMTLPAPIEQMPSIKASLLNPLPILPASKIMLPPPLPTRVYQSNSIPK